MSTSVTSTRGCVELGAPAAAAVAALRPSRSLLEELTEALTEAEAEVGAEAEAEELARLRSSRAHLVRVRVRVRVRVGVGSGMGMGSGLGLGFGFGIGLRPHRKQKVMARGPWASSCGAVRRCSGASSSRTSPSLSPPG